MTTLSKPADIIQKHCKKNNVQPLELITVLLDRLYELHYHQSRGYAGVPQNQTNVITEIQVYMGLAQQVDGDKRDFPLSVLSSVQLSVGLKAWQETHNAQYLRDKLTPGDDTGIANHYEHGAKVVVTLLNILRELANQAEQMSLEELVRMTENQKKKPDSPPTE